MNELYERILTDLSLAITRAEQFNYPVDTVQQLIAARRHVLNARAKLQEISEPSWPDTNKDREAVTEARRRLGSNAAHSAVVDLAQKLKKEML